MTVFSADPYVRIVNRLVDKGEICSGGFDPKNDPDDRQKLLIAVLVILGFTFLFVASCGCTRSVYVPIERTTTVVETLRDTVVEVKVEQVRDTVTVETAGRDTTSYLSNGISYSYASLVGGRFGHSLGTHPGAKVKDSVKMKVVHITDSIPYPVTVEVEKKLTFWQSVKMEYGGIGIGATLAMAVVFGLVILTGRMRRD